MEIVFKNNRGESVTQNAERFDIHGTIMTAHAERVADCILHRLYVEDGQGGYHITIWNTATGYNPDKLKVGNSVRFRGLLHKQYYCGGDGTGKCYLDYKANEMMA